MKKLYFFIFWDFERSFSRFFLKICQWCCQNWILHPQRNVLRKNVFVEKNYNFMSLSHIERKKSGFCRNCSGLNVKLAFYLSIGIFWGERSLTEFLFSNYDIWTMSEHFFSAFCRKFLGRGIQNCNLHIDRKFLRKISFSSVEKPFLSFPFGKNNLKRSFGNLLFLHFSDNGWKFFSQLPQKFRRSCQNRIMHLRRKNLKKKRLF